jgi:glycosyltransferase involved in cell wall biosynthesis
MTGVEKSKHVLVIAYDFPPRRTSGVYRPTGLIKYLPGLGWEPTVLTVKPYQGDLVDATLLAKIPPQVPIVQTRTLRLSAWEDSTAKTLQETGFLRPEGHPRRPSIPHRVLRRIASFVRSCLYFPDVHVGWVPFAVWKARQLIRRHRFDVVYTTSPPRSGLVVGLLLKACLGVPWVAEFRDPWYPTPRPFRRKFEGWLLRLILRRADSVVVLTEGFRAELETAHPQSAKKVVMLRSGYDEEDFANVSGPPRGILPSGYLHMTHLGTVYPGHSGNFFPALAELLKEEPQFAPLVRVNIVGYPDETVEQFATNSALRGIVQLRDFVHHDEAIRIMTASDCLLLFLGSRRFSRQAVSGKLFEYLRSGRPILAVAYAGDLKQLIEASGAGWVVEPEDSSALKQALRTVLHNGKRAHAPARVRWEFVEQFRYDRLAVKLAEILEAARHDR